jgi:ABC-2 type transport system ATP-binding protein
MARRRRDIFLPPNPKTYIVQATKLTSKEVYAYPDGRKETVLHGINLEIRRGESWGIVCNEPFESEMLMEIIGSVRPYGEGRCTLVERGMMRRKRMILPHVFFISEAVSLPTNMNTLEYLMYVTSHSKLAAQPRQAVILKLLLSSNLYYLTLVPIKYLSSAERVAISLMTASLSGALLVIFSVAGLKFDERLAGGMRKLSDIITNRGSALLIGTDDCDMVQTVCSHAAFLLSGNLSHHGTMPEVLAYLDKRAYILHSNTPRQLADALKAAEPALDARVYGQEVHLYDSRTQPITETELLTLLLHTGQTVVSLQESAKTLENAFKEVVSGHDL